MTPREYSKKINRLKCRRENLLNRIRDLRKSRTALSGIRYDDVRVQTSGSGESRTNTVTERIIDLEREYYSLSLELDETISAFMDAILKLPDIRQQDVMVAHWVNEEKLYDYSIRINASYDYIRHIHSEACNEFQKINNTK